MEGEFNRYFIELQPGDGTSVPRNRENEMRRAQAARFLEKVGAWLKQHELSGKVATLAVTALGQVQITCEPAIISQMRSEDDLNIASIRPGAMYTETMHRWEEAR